MKTTDAAAVDARLCAGAVRLGVCGVGVVADAPVVLT